MNRTLLIMTTAAIVLVGIAVGLLLPAAGQTGQLSGALGPVPTSINLSASECYYDHILETWRNDVSGYLVDSSGNPVIGRTVQIGTYRCTPEYTCTQQIDSVVTGSDGRFSIKKPIGGLGPAELGPYAKYQASFKGDSAYGPSTSIQIDSAC